MVLAARDGAADLLGDMVRPVRILVVDDEKQIAQLLTGVLEGEGYEVEFTTEPEMAVARLGEERFDLLLTDLRMPRMGGMELIEEARRIRPEMDTLIMTAFASAETAVGALRSGVADYLSKPFGVAEVRSAVGRALEARAKRQEDERRATSLTERVAAQEQDLAQNVADLSFLHDMTRLIADRDTPLRSCLGALARHLGCDQVILTEGDRILERVGPAGDAAELVQLARDAAKEGLSRLGAPGCIAAPAARGAVAARRKAAFGKSDLRLMSIAGRDLAMAVENDRLRAEQRRSYLGIVATLIEAVEAKDRFNRGHSRRVAELAGAFARRLSLPEREIELIETGAKLHDIGKIGVPEDILNKPGSLTDDEFDVIKSHPVIGEQILRPLDFLAEARPIVRHHHERWDGAGYPDGLSAGAIPRPAALLSIVDAYDAMTSTRPYREGLPRERALAILGEGAGAQWDPALVDKFDFV